jgi:hypothetical protein
MKVAELIDLLNEVEHSLPVDEWTIASVPAWPVLRIQLAMDLFVGEHTVSGALVSSVPRRALTEFLHRQLRFASAWRADMAGNERHRGQVDALLLSDGVSFVQLAGRQYERFCDPIRDRLQATGRSSTLLVPGDRFPHPRYSPSRFIQPALDLVRLRNRVAAQFSTPSERLPGFGTLLMKMEKRALPMPVSLDALRRQLRLVAAYARYFEGTLGRVQPRVCFLVSYYWLIGYGLLLACRRLGVPAVDLQHGYQGDLHQSYGRWSKVPEGGYAVLPSWFWCWQRSDVAAIRRWAGGTGGAHRAVAGGNLFLEMWRASVLSVTGPDAEFLERVSRPVVLVTLQTGLLTPAFVDLLREAIRRSDGSLAWWLRLHPVMLNERDQVLAHFSELHGVEIDRPTSLPLYALLRHVDVHVTLCSSVVVEAEAFGVRSILCSHLGVEVFASQIARGIAVYADEPADLLDQIRIQMSRRAPAGEVAQEAMRVLDRGHRLVDAFVAGAPAEQIEALGES